MSRENVLSKASESQSSDSAGKQSYVKENSVGENSESLWKCYLLFWRNYFKFSGRARRREYWVPALVSLVAIIVMSFCVATDDEAEIYTDCINVLFGYLLVTLIPMFSVFVRRLHDVGKSMWWATGFYALQVCLGIFASITHYAENTVIATICGLIIWVAWIYVFIQLVKTGDSNPNKYGLPRKNK